jgi:hypothetical protein
MDGLETGILYTFAGSVDDQYQKRSMGSSFEHDQDGL